ncbi:MAG: hypothetical protein M1826_001573 [Phylliscum demangeonii]|nr:MAG: hypothetical protein M1826_001573 [Phylliscum demangeonii]
MQLQALLICAVTALAATVAAMPAAGPDAAPALGISARDLAVRSLLEKRKNCSGSRHEDEVCGGKKLQKQNSFHNCKNSGGKCCALDADGSKGINVDLGGGSEDCGFCFSGKCKA